MWPTLRSLHVSLVHSRPLFITSTPPTSQVSSTLYRFIFHGPHSPQHRCPHIFTTRISRAIEVTYLFHLLLISHDEPTRYVLYFCAYLSRIMCSIVGQIYYLTSYARVKIFEVIEADRFQKGLREAQWHKVGVDEREGKVSISRQTASQVIYRSDTRKLRKERTETRTSKSKPNVNVRGRTRSIGHERRAGRGRKLKGKRCVRSTGRVNAGIRPDRIRSRTES
jgi:hypothetical protein